MSKNVLFISEQKLKDSSFLSENIDPKQLRPILKTAQDMYIHRALGTALYDKLQTDIQNNALAGNYLTLVNDYITDALLWYALVDVGMSTQYKWVNKGIMQRLSENAQTIDHLNTRHITDWCKNKAEWYTERLTAYLCANSTLFPEYKNPGSTADTIHPEKSAYTSPFAFGCDREDNRSFEQKYQG